jgi:hypothetical protein
MSPDKRKSNNASGVFVIAMVMLLETTLLDHSRPNAATPWIRGMLILIAAASFVAAIWFHRKSRRPDA